MKSKFNTRFQKWVEGAGARALLALVCSLLIVMLGLLPTLLLRIIIPQIENAHPANDRYL